MIKLEKILYHPVRPDVTIKATYDKENKTILCAGSNGYAQIIHKVEEEDFDEKVAAVAYEIGYLQSKPKYSAVPSPVVWIIEEQDENELYISYILNGKCRKTRIVVPGLSKNIEAELLRDTISTVLQKEIQRSRLVGLAGSFEDKSMSNFTKSEYNDEQKTDEQKTDEQKTDEQKTDEQKTDEQKTDEQKTDEQSTDEQSTDEQKTDEQSTDEQNTDAEEQLYEQEEENPDKKYIMARQGISEDAFKGIRTTEEDYLGTKTI